MFSSFPLLCQTPNICTFYRRSIYFDSQSLSPGSLSPLCLGLSKAEHHGKGCDREAVPLTGSWSRESEGKTGRDKNLILFKGIPNYLISFSVSLPFLLKFLSPSTYICTYVRTHTHIYTHIRMEYISIYYTIIHI